MYRILTIGSTNRGTRMNLHFYDTAHAQEINEPTWRLPDAPCAVEDVSTALKSLFQCPEFDGRQLRRAVRLVKEMVP